MSFNLIENQKTIYYLANIKYNQLGGGGGGGYNGAMMTFCLPPLSGPPLIPTPKQNPLVEPSQRDETVNLILLFYKVTKNNRFSPKHFV